MRPTRWYSQSPHQSQHILVIDLSRQRGLAPNPLLKRHTAAQSGPGKAVEKTEGMGCTATYSSALPLHRENTVGDYTKKPRVKAGVFKEILQSAMQKKERKNAKSFGSSSQWSPLENHPAWLPRGSGQQPGLVLVTSRRVLKVAPRVQPVPFARQQPRLAYEAAALGRGEARAVNATNS